MLLDFGFMHACMDACVEADAVFAQQLNLAQ